MTSYSRYKFGFLALGVWLSGIGLYGVVGPHTQREYVTYVIGVAVGVSLLAWQRALLGLWRFDG